MSKNNLRAAAAFLAALALGCRRPTLPTAATSAMTPPQPPRPLSSDATGYTNEQQAANLRSEAAELGIRGLGKPSAHGSDLEEDRAPISYDEGIKRTREYAAQFEAERHALERDKPKSVSLPGATPGMIPPRVEGAPIKTNKPDNEN